MRPALLLLLLILLPLAELEILWRVGSLTGAWPVIGLLLAAALAGGLIIRGQGLRLAAELRAQMLSGRLPGQTLLNAAAIMLAGGLLIVPGFLTDLAGLLLLAVPPLRRWAAGRLQQALSRRMPAAAGIRIFNTTNADAPMRPDRPGDAAILPGGIRETTVRVVEEDHGQERM